MEFHLLKTFEVVATLMSFNQAAQVLHCTQSAVSARIKALEQDLGAPVFERLGRRIALTPSGEELLRHVRRLLNYEQDVRAAVRDAGETVGLISLRAPQSVADVHLPPILKRFCAEYPRVGFDVSNCGYFHLPDELRAGRIDAGFLLSMCLDAADLECTVVLEEPMAFVVHPSSDLAVRTGLGIEDLAGRTLLVPKHDCAYRMHLQQQLAESRTEAAAVLELNSVTALVTCLREGFGVALLPERTVAAELGAGRLAKLAWREAQSARLFFIRHREKPRVGAYGAFVDMVEKYFEGLQSGGRHD